MMLSRIFLIAVFALLASTAQAAPAGAVGMVLDVQGSGRLQDGAASSKLELLAYVKPGMRIALDDGSRASVSLYATRTVYQLAGPGMVEVGSDKLSVIHGKEPASKTIREKLVAAAKGADLVPGAVRMRTLPATIEFLAPQGGSAVLEQRPVFVWQAPPAPVYLLAVYDGAGRQIAEGKSEQSHWELPAGVTLAERGRYRWTVSYAGADGAMQTAGAKFTVASRQDAAVVADLKPAAAAPMEEWILYAAMLQERGLQSAAREVWQYIASQRPDLEKARELGR